VGLKQAGYESISNLTTDFQSNQSGIETATSVARLINIEVFQSNQSGIETVVIPPRGTDDPAFNRTRVGLKRASGTKPVNSGLGDDIHQNKD